MEVGFGAQGAVLYGAEPTGSAGDRCGEGGRAGRRKQGTAMAAADRRTGALRAGRGQRL